MKHIRALLLFGHLVLCLAVSAPAAASPWQILVAAPQKPAEELALVDLQRYLAQAGGEVPQVVTPRQWRAHPQPAVILGTPQSNPLLRELGLNLKDLGPQGYSLANASLRSQPVVVAAGVESDGAVNAIYGLLRELGYGFFLGSESVPDTLPAQLAEGLIRRRPCFTIRGVLPWYNFFNSPTVWDPADHRAFVDQLVRQGANFVGFHTYDDEPFAAYPEGSQMRWGARLRNTESPNWGTHPMTAAAFAWDTDKVFDADFFGAATTRMAGNSNRVVQLEQDILRDALAYARQRGLRTCLGFEINADPTNPKDREVFLKRINRLLDQYPRLDFIWLWQPETQGAQGYTDRSHTHQLRDLFEPGSALGNYGLTRREVFRRAVERAEGERPFFQDTEAGRAARAREGARLEQFARLALRALSHRRQPPRLAISGWGGDERLLSAEYYDGLDQLLPPSVAFSSLDHIWPRPRIDRAYAALPPQRERWPIPWLELDGDQWHPQPYVHTFEAMARDARQSGSQGILGIHWRTRDIEQNFAFLVDYAWQPGLTAQEFFRQYARRTYAPAIAGELASIHVELDQMGYRWVGGSGQGECAPFAWGPGEDARAQKLGQLQARARRLLPRAGGSAARLEWLLAEMEWVLRFQQAEKAAVNAGQLLAEHKPSEALVILNGDGLAQALHAFARRITTRGEQGVLATINTKAVYAWQDLRRQAQQAAGLPAAASPVKSWNPAPQILLPRFIGSVTAGQPVEVSPICLGGKAAWLHYRTLGASGWKSLPLSPVKGWVCRVVIPASEVAMPGLQFGFSFNADHNAPMALGPMGVTVMPASAVAQKPHPKFSPGKSAKLTLAVRATAKFPAELTWNDLPAADFFKVYRDGQFLGDTAVTFFPDAPRTAAGERDYRVEAWRDGKIIASAQKHVRMPDGAVLEAPKVSATPQADGLILQWPALDSQYVTSFQLRLHRDAASGPHPADNHVPTAGQAASTAPVTVPALSSGVHSRTVTLTPGRWTLELVSLGQTGRQSSPAAFHFDWPLPVQKRRLELPLTEKPAQAKVMGKVTFGESGARFNGGHLELASDERFNPGASYRLSFEFKAEQVDAMPVLLGHGLWQVEGWFAQILGGRLIIRTPTADAEGPAIEPGRWYAVTWEVVSGKHRLLVDGHEVMSSRDLNPVPVSRPLLIGQYASEFVKPDFAFHGTLRHLVFETAEPVLR